MPDSLTGLGTNTTIFRIEPNWRRPVTYENLLSSRVLGYPGTVQEVLSFSEDIPIVLQARFTNLSKEEENSLLEFFYNQQGRLKAFWILGDTKQFELTQIIPQNSSVLYVEDQGFADIYRGYERIYLDMVNGDLITRKIISVTEGPGQGELTLQLDTVTDRQIQKGDYRKFGLLYFVRFDRDKITVTYGSNSTSDVTLSFRELCKEYP